MNRNILLALLISLAAHIFIIGVLVLLNTSNTETAFGKEYVIEVKVYSEERKQTADISKGAPKKQKERRLKRTSPKGGDGQRGTDKKMTGDRGGSEILSQIKARIESVKRYPRLAKKMGIEGRPLVLFAINEDGSLRYVKIKRSSGKDVIDKAALETVKRSVPLPFYSKPIKLRLKFELTK